MKIKQTQFILTFLLAVLAGTVAVGPVWAQSENEIKDQIESTNERIQELNSEISDLSSDLSETREEKQTLQTAVSSLDESVERISQKVQGTQTEIAKTRSEIANLEDKISAIETDMEQGRAAIARTIKLLQRSGNQTLVETLLAADSLAQAWGQIDQIQQVQAEVRKQINQLAASKSSLEAQQAAVEAERAELSELREQYADQQAIVESQKQEKAELLAETNQEASRYQELIAKKRAQKEAFEQQLRQFEQQLNSSASGATVPSGAGQFVWPVTPVRITQQFGGTEFAKRNPSAYGRPFHNGTDFGVPVGTPVRSVAAGTVRASGNTDAVSGCYSYGKWVLVDHVNGLSTLYAHLSRISATAGSQVAQGERIGYSGNSGYSTGPHLHLTTYVRQDVRVVALGDVKERTNCASAEIPVAPLESYLNSMEYLP